MVFAERIYHMYLVIIHPHSQQNKKLKSIQNEKNKNSKNQFSFTKNGRYAPIGETSVFLNIFHIMFMVSVIFGQ